MTSNTTSQERRYDLDWLRVIVFGLLILYHVGMMYVSWGWHIKSGYELRWLESVMLLVNPWRLSLLFLISGAAVGFAWERLSIGAYFAKRSLRLLLPLAFGMLVIIPPQMYFQLRQDGLIEPGYLRFLERYWAFDQTLGIAIPEYTHLWFVVFLWAYSLVSLPVFWALSTPLVKGWLDRLAARISPIVMLLAPATPLVLSSVFLRPHFPETHWPLDDWYNHGKSFTLFLYGFILAGRPLVWAMLASLRIPALIISLAAYFSVTTLHYSVDAAGLPPFLEHLTFGLHNARVWTSIVAILGYGYVYLRFNSPVLRYLNRAIFSYYILHQTLIIWIGFYLVQAGLPVGAEAALVIYGDLCRRGPDL